MDYTCREGRGGNVPATEEAVLVERPRGGLAEAARRLAPHLPVPVFWLFGKTQTGKTTIIKFLTGAEQAEIGQGYKPCTRFSREYNFPTDETPLATFLDTRGLDEPGTDRPR